MEKYSKHLEVLVAERTQDLMHEKQRTDRLLYSTARTQKHRNTKIQTYIYKSIHWEDDDLKTSEESDISAYANDTIDGNINTNIGN